MKPLRLAASLLLFSSQIYAEEPPSNVDYPTFRVLTADLEPIRKAHQVSIDRFLEMATEPNTIILDTRSAAAFDEIHLAGAIHLNFSDFTEPKLAEVIPEKTTRILIYCNNNFISTQEALFSKVGHLALNIPTFINLFGYGYENVYELENLLRTDDPRLNFEGTAVSLVPQRVSVR